MIGADGGEVDGSAAVAGLRRRLLFRRERIPRNRGTRADAVDARSRTPSSSGWARDGTACITRSATGRTTSSWWSDTPAPGPQGVDRAHQRPGEAGRVRELAPGDHRDGQCGAGERALGVRFHRPPLGRWSRGRVTLIGDAAHALVPHHGQGADRLHRGRHRPGRPAPVQLRLGRRPSGVRAASSGTARARCSTPPSRSGMSITCPMGRGPTSGMPDWLTPTRSSAIWAGSTPSSPTSRSPTSRAVAPGSDV